MTEKTETDKMSVGVVNEIGLNKMNVDKQQAMPAALNSVEHDKIDYSQMEMMMKEILKDFRDFNNIMMSMLGDVRNEIAESYNNIDCSLRSTIGEIKEASNKLERSFDNRIDGLLNQMPMGIVDTNLDTQRGLYSQEVENQIMEFKPESSKLEINTNNKVGLAQKDTSETKCEIVGLEVNKITYDIDVEKSQVLGPSTKTEQTSERVEDCEGGKIHEYEVKLGRISNFEKLGEKPNLDIQLTRGMQVVEVGLIRSYEGGEKLDPGHTFSAANNSAIVRLRRNRNRKKLKGGRGVKPKTKRSRPKVRYKPVSRQYYLLRRKPKLKRLRTRLRAQHKQKNKNKKPQKRKNRMKHKQTDRAKQTTVTKSTEAPRSCTALKYVKTRSLRYKVLYRRCRKRKKKR